MNYFEEQLIETFRKFTQNRHKLPEFNLSSMNDGHGTLVQKPQILQNAADRKLILPLTDDVVRFFDGFRN